MNDQNFILIAGLPNLNEYDYAEQYKDAIIITEKEAYQTLFDTKMQVKKNIMGIKDQNARILVQNEINDNEKETMSYITRRINSLVKEALLNNNLVVVVYRGLNFRERGYIMENIKDIKCRKSLIFFYKNKSEYIELNKKLYNQLSDQEIDKLYSDIDIPDSKYVEGFDQLFLF